jgi:thiamine biosynthesis lipoprotein
MATERLTRRRALGLLAAAAGLPLALRASHATAEVVTWRGRALGAPATLVLHHPDRAAAERLLAACAAELSRLEAIFSLYRAESALSELNRTGALAAPPRELVAILEDCRRYHAATDGAFDPTIQPVWRLYASHFAAGGAPEGPPPAALAEARARIGLDAVRVSPDRIAFAHPSMGLTLNGIAQGWITDRIIDLLESAGVTSTLVDMGEIRALGDKAGTPWRASIAHCDIILPLTNRAVATSSPAGFCFDPAARFGHILDPRTGLPVSALVPQMIVTAATAADADALSTALVLVEPKLAARVLGKIPGAAIAHVCSDALSTGTRS